MKVSPTMKRARDVEARFWGLVREGLSVTQAGYRVGIARRTSYAWAVRRGGIAPPVGRDPSAEEKGRYLSLAEREQIAVLWAAGDGINAIGRALGRPGSTISRELDRNKLMRTNRKGADGRRRVAYQASVAQWKAQQRAHRPKPTKLATCSQLRERVQAGLQQRWSPQQISHRLRQEFPDQPEMQVSHETIYQALYVQGRGELRRELAACLRTGRAVRRTRGATGRGRGKKIPDMVMISERPAEAKDRAVPGHWEGDLIIGKDGKSAVGTLVERTTRYVLLLHLDGDRTAATVQAAMTAAIKKLPAHLWRSLTWDQGSEMACHRELTADTGLRVYFCDPHSPWQRGSNENTNGLLRQYLPKGSDLSVHSPEDLDAIACQLNGRPRQTLNWHTPAEALNQLLSQPTNPTGVATTP